MDGASTAIVPVLPEPLIVQLLRDAGRDPLERLDESLAQTSEWAQLREILMGCPDWVRNNICHLLAVEMSRSFQNVVAQFQASRKIAAEMQDTLSSEDAQALGHLIKDIHPSSINALQREADGIHNDISALREDLEKGQITHLQNRATRVSNKAKRFRSKYEELRPKLDRLHTKMQVLANKCADAADTSDTLIEQTKQRRDYWFSLLCRINYVAAVGGVLVFAGAGGTALVAGMMLMTKTSALGSATAALGAANSAAAKSVAIAGAKATAASAAKAKATEAAAAALKAAAAVSSSGNPAVGAGVTAAAGVAGGVAGAAAFGPAGLAVLAAGASAAGACAIWSAIAHSAAVTATQAASHAASIASALQAAAAAAQQAATAAAAASATAAAQATQAAASVNSLQLAVNSLSAVLTTASPFVIGSASILALCLLGYMGRDLFKSLLARLWAAEIQQHEKSKAAFLRMSQMLRETAKQLRTICDRSEALETCLDLVVEVAEDLAGTAEDAQVTLEPQVLDDEMLKMHEQVNRLCSAYSTIPRAFEQLHAAIRDLSLPEPTSRSLQNGDPSMEDLQLQFPADGEAAHTVPAQVDHLVVRASEPEEWILIDSPPSSRSSRQESTAEALPLIDEEEDYADLETLSPAALEQVAARQAPRDPGWGQMSLQPCT